MTYYERKSVLPRSKKFTDAELSTGDTRVIGFWWKGQTPNKTKMQRVFEVVSPDELHIKSYKDKSPGIQQATERILMTNAINKAHLHTNKGTRIIWKPPQRH